MTAETVEGMSKLVEEGDDVLMLHESGTSSARLGKIGDHGDDGSRTLSLGVDEARNKSPYSGVPVPA